MKKFLMILGFGLLVSYANLNQAQAQSYFVHVEANTDSQYGAGSRVIVYDHDGVTVAVYRTLTPNETASLYESIGRNFPGSVFETDGSPVGGDSGAEFNMGGCLSIYGCERYDEYGNRLNDLNNYNQWSF